MNESQLEAITTRIPNVLVSAGAGSGKTTVLTQRYFHLLDEKIDGKPLKIDEILTLTFTRKAAQEMRERIARKLDEEGRRHERRELNRAPIGTIHSFCESVLREQALQAGIDPNFRLLDDAEAKTLQENALDTIFEDLWSGSQQEREEIGRLLLEMPQDRLRRAIRDLYGSTRTQGIALDELHAYAPATLDNTITVLSAAVNDLLALEGTPKWREALIDVQEAYDALLPMLSAAEFSWDLYYSAQQLVKRLTPSGGPRQVATTARKAVKAAAEAWFGALLDLAAQPYLSAFLALLKRFGAAYKLAKDAQGLLDFEDLLLITRNLLLSESQLAQPLCRRYRQIMVDEFQDTNPLQFSIIHALQGDDRLFMVGDVKQAIYRFIGSDIRVFLKQEQRILDMEGRGLRIPMHTNYRTRPEVLEPLNRFFASLWPLDRFDDGFTFEPLSAGREFIPKAQPSIEMAFWKREAKNGPGAAELRDREAIWISRRILQLTGHLHEPALQITHSDAEGVMTGRDARFGDVIILFRASTDIPLYEDALRQAGIPFYVVSGRGFFGTREVQDIIYLLRALENPMDDFSLAVVLRSPLASITDDTLYWLARDWDGWQEGHRFPAQTPKNEFGHLWANILRADSLPPIIEDDRQALRRFRNMVQDLQPELAAGQPLDLIDMILAKTNYASMLLAMDGGEQRYANVQKLRQVASTFQARGIFDLADFQRFLTQLSEQAPREASAPVDVEGSNVVRLMTIHASKGLEAPIVFLADGGREPNDIREPFLLTTDGISCLVPTPEDESERPAAYLSAVEALTRDDRREAERLLYVALTRAREHLICCGYTRFPEPEKRVSYADLLAGVLGLVDHVQEDTDIPVDFEESTFPVRVWSPSTLEKTCRLSTPEQSPTLWEAYRDAILSGGDLPILTDAGEVERFAQVMDRLRLLPTTRREGPLRIGVHKALCYHACPRQYWFRYVLNDDAISLPSPVTADETAAPPLIEDDEQERMDGTEFGKMLHGVMQRVDFASSLPEQLPEILQQLAAESPIEVSPADMERLTGCLQTFSALPFAAQLQRASQIHRELRFLVREGEVFVPGIIDVLANIDDEWVVLDYKTGQPSGNHMRQVAIYALGVQHTLGVTPNRMVLAYLDAHGGRPYRDELVNTALLDDVRRIIRDTADGVRSEQYAPTTGRQCARCAYLGACPEGRQTQTDTN